MPSVAQSWTVACRACDVVIGAFVGGRFIHDPSCAWPLAIGRGNLRCCRCAGELSLERQPALVDEAEDDAASEVIVLAERSSRRQQIR